MHGFTAYVKRVRARSRLFVMDLATGEERMLFDALDLRDLAGPHWPHGLLCMAMHAVFLLGLDTEHLHDRLLRFKALHKAHIEAFARAHPAPRGVW